jgi:hypothetical protein
MLDPISIDKALSKMDVIEQYRMRRAIRTLADRIHITFYEAADLVAQCAWVAL